MASLAELRMEEPDEIVASEPEVRPEELRILEALLFASAEPLEQATLAKRMPEGVDIKAALAQLDSGCTPRPRTPDWSEAELIIGTALNDALVKGTEEAVSCCDAPMTPREG